MSAWPPGPRGLPLLGNAREFVRDPLGFLDACGRYPGDVVGIDLGGRRMCVLTDPDDVGFVLSAHGERFVKATYRDRTLATLLGNGVLLSEGETWRRHRNLLAPAFAADRLTDVARAAVDHAEATVERWRAGEVLDVHAATTRLAVRVTADALFGTRLDPAATERIVETLAPIQRRLEPRILGTLLPGWVPTDVNRAYRRAVADLDAALAALVRESSDDGTDVVSILRRARAAGQVDDREVRDELVTVLLAGHDTTALALAYTFHLLGANRRADRALAAEATAVLGDRRPTAADAARLAYANRVVSESLRLFPPVFAVFRKPLAPVTLGGYRLPAGTPLVLPQWVVHRDARHYDAPAAFDPDRWLPERAARRHRFAYFPFGGGPRHCIGRRVALTVLPLVLAVVARRYRLEPTADAPLPLRTSITLRPGRPIRMQVTER